MNCRKEYVCLVCLSILAACGGGSSGGDTTSTAVSNPVTGDAGGGNPSNGDGTFPTVLEGAVSGGNTTTPETTSFQGLTADIRFDSDYNLRVLVTETTGDREIVRLTDADLQSVDDGLRLYQNEQAILLSNTPESAVLGQQLEYTTFGRWREFDGSGSLAFIDAAAFFAGVPTRSGSEMPTTGSVTYNGAASAQVLAKNQTSVVALLGDVTATANFDSATLDLRMQLSRPRTGARWGDVSATDLAISGDRFSGATAQSTRGHRGTVSGRFFGPDAAEVGGAADLSDDNSILQIGFGAAR